MGDVLLSVRGPRWDRIRVVAWFFIVTIGAVYTWAARNEMNPDGLSYLDIADDFASGNWHVALNRYWSPLYPALIAVALRVLHPSSRWEFGTIHVLNYLIFLGAFASFEFFLSQLIRYHRQAEAMRSSARTALPEWALRIVGYTLFAYSVLELNRFTLLTPDVCASATIYLASGVLLTIALRPQSTLAFPLLGAILGLGYLAKAPMFPLAFVFLALAAVMVFSRCPPLAASLRVAAGFIGFAVVASVLVIGFHGAYGRWTLGESGRLNYAWHVNRVPYIHWQGGIPGSGSPAHPTRRILLDPPVYEFATPVGGTYPPWHDPAYWYEGVKVHFDATDQERVLERSMGVLVVRVFPLHGVLAVLALLLLYLGRGGGLFIRRLAAYAILLVPALAAFAIFSPIHMEERYVAPFVTLFWLSIVAAIPWPAPDRDQWRLKVVLGAMLVTLTVFTWTDPNSRLFWTIHTLDESLPRADSFSQWTVAEGLHTVGVQHGDSVAVIGSSFYAYWARLARVRIVAEMPACVITRYSRSCLEGQPDGVAGYLAADGPTQARILKAFAQTGAKAVVIRSGRPLRLPGWQRISGTDHYLYRLGK